MNRQVTLATIIILWVINELFQYLEILNSFRFSSFIVFHASSFYGAVVFCFLVEYLEFHQFFFIIPLLIEMGKSYLTYGIVDFMDLVFSLFGILINVFVFKKKY